MKYILTVLFILCIGLCAHAQAKKNIVLKKLTGTWVSTEDKKYRVIIKGSIMQEYYDKEKTAVLRFRIHRNLLTAKDIKTGDVFKYDLVTVNNKQLTMIYLGRGNTLSFRRK